MSTGEVKLVGDDHTATAVGGWACVDLDEPKRKPEGVGREVGSTAELDEGNGCVGSTGNELTKNKGGLATSPVVEVDTNLVDVKGDSVAGYPVEQVADAGSVDVALDDVLASGVPAFVDGGGGDETKRVSFGLHQGDHKVGVVHGVGSLGGESGSEIVDEPVFSLPSLLGLS